MAGGQEDFDISNFLPPPTHSRIIPIKFPTFQLIEFVAVLLTWYGVHRS